MRLLFPVAIMFAGATPALPAKPPPLSTPGADCPAASSQWVRDGNSWRSRPLTPQKLSELPPAESFAAVYRLDERGCMVPVKFREIRR